MNCKKYKSYVYNINLISIYLILRHVSHQTFKVLSVCESEGKISLHKKWNKTCNVIKLLYL